MCLVCVDYIIVEAVTMFNILSYNALLAVTDLDGALSCVARQRRTRGRTLHALAAVHSLAVPCLAEPRRCQVLSAPRRSDAVNRVSGRLLFDGWTGLLELGTGGLCRPVNAHQRLHVDSQGLALFKLTVVLLIRTL